MRGVTPKTAEQLNSPLTAAGTRRSRHHSGPPRALAEGGVPWPRHKATAARGLPLAMGAITHEHRAPHPPWGHLLPPELSQRQESSGTVREGGLKQNQPRVPRSNILCATAKMCFEHP